MALLFIESFDGYSTGELTRGRWNTAFGTVSPSNRVEVLPGTGRYGTQSAGLRYYDVIGPLQKVYLTKTLAAASVWVVGFAFATTFVFRPRDILAFLDGDIPQVDVVLHTDGTLEVTRNGVTLGRTSSGATSITQDTYYFIEIKVRIHQTQGSVHLRINSQLVLALTNIDTQHSPNAQMTQVVFGNPRVGITPPLDPLQVEWTYYDDVYVLDTTGPAPHQDFLGDCRVLCGVPIGQELTEFTPSAGTNWEAVDERPPSVADYNEAATVGQRDRFQYEPLPALVNPLVYGVQLSLYATNPDVGPRQIAAHCLSGGVELDGIPLALPGTYSYVQDLFVRDPQGALWTTTTLPAARFGYKIVG